MQMSASSKVGALLRRGRVNVRLLPRDALLPREAGQAAAERLPRRALLTLPDWPLKLVAVADDVQEFFDEAGEVETAFAA